MRPKVEHSELEGKVITGQKGKALFLVRQGKKLMFPDFYTFTKLGYNVSMINKVSDDTLHELILGETIAKIDAPPPFRPDDYMYHAVCEDIDRLVRVGCADDAFFFFFLLIFAFRSTSLE